MTGYTKWEIQPSIVSWGPFEVPQSYIDWLIERDRRDREWTWNLFINGSFRSN